MLSSSAAPDRGSPSSCCPFLSRYLLPPLLFFDPTAQAEAQGPASTQEGEQRGENGESETKSAEAKGGGEAAGSTKGAAGFGIGSSLAAARNAHAVLAARALGRLSGLLALADSETETERRVREHLASENSGALTSAAHGTLPAGGASLFESIPGADGAFLDGAGGSRGAAKRKEGGAEEDVAYVDIRKALRRLLTPTLATMLGAPDAVPLLTILASTVETPQVCPPSPFWNPLGRHCRPCSDSHSGTVHIEPECALASAWIRLGELVQIYCPRCWGTSSTLPL